MNWKNITSYLTICLIGPFCFGYAFYTMGYQKGSTYVLERLEKKLVDKGFDYSKIEPNDVQLESGINFEYDHQTGILEMRDPYPNTFYDEKEMYWTYWPDGKSKVLITYKASQSLKDRMKQYAFSN